jgi:hypothetical protein
MEISSDVEHEKVFNELYEKNLYKVDRKSIKWRRIRYDLFTLRGDVTLLP